MNILFPLFCSSKPWNQVRILIYRNWSIEFHVFSYLHILEVFGSEGISEVESCPFFLCTEWNGTDHHYWQSYLYNGKEIGLHLYLKGDWNKQLSQHLICRTYLIHFNPKIMEWPAVLFFSWLFWKIIWCCRLASTATRECVEIKTDITFSFYPRKWALNNFPIWIR